MARYKYRPACLKETKRKMSKANKGKHFSLNTEFKKGHKISLETRTKMSQVRKAKPMRYWLGKKKEPWSKEVKEKISASHRGQKCLIETKRKIVQTLKNRNKAKVLSLDVQRQLFNIRRSLDYRLWQEAVWKRDGYKCRKCYNYSNQLRCHHIKNFVQYAELRFEIDNGVTLCDNCHKEFHKIYGKLHNSVDYIEEFLDEIQFVAYPIC